MLEPVDLKAWAEAERASMKRNYSRIVSEELSDERALSRHQAITGASLDAALEHLPEREPPLFVAGTEVTSEIVVPDVRTCDGKEGRPTLVHGVVLVTHKRVLAIHQLSGRAKLDHPVLIERAIGMLSEYSRTSVPKNGDRVDLKFGKKAMCIHMLVPEEADRLMSLLRELTGG